MTCAGPSTAYRIAGLASAALLVLAIGTGLIHSLYAEKRLPSISIFPNPHVEKLARSGEWARVVVELEGQLRLGTNSVRRSAVLMILGFALAKLDRHDEAIERYRAAIVLEPDDVDIRIALLQSLWHERRLEEVVEEARAVLARDPDQEDAQSLLTAALERLGRAENAASE